MVRLLVENGANVNQRATGCFFLPEDQKKRMTKSTNYKGAATLHIMIILYNTVIYQIYFTWIGQEAILVKARAYRGARHGWHYTIFINVFLVRNWDFSLDENSPSFTPAATCDQFGALMALCGILNSAPFYPFSRLKSAHHLPIYSHIVLVHYS